MRFKSRVSFPLVISKVMALAQFGWEIFVNFWCHFVANVEKWLGEGCWKCIIHKCKCTFGTQTDNSRNIYGFMVSTTKEITGARGKSGIRCLCQSRGLNLKWMEVREKMYLPASVRAMKRDILIVCEDIKFRRRRYKYISWTFNWLELSIYYPES